MLVSELFYSAQPDISHEVHKNGIIYQCKNLVNGKIYIGESSSSIWWRWIGDRSIMTHIYEFDNGCNRILYKALRKYGLDKFDVSVIESDLVDTTLRLDREKYWIKELHTCIYDPLCHGYNMTWGGEDCSQLYTPSARLKAMESDKLSHGGKMGWNTEESIRKANETRAQMYDGDPYGMIHTKESKLKSLESNRNNHGGILNIEIPEVRERAIKAAHSPDAVLRNMNTQRLNHGGVLAFDTKDSINRSIETRVSRYGSPTAHMMTEESQILARDNSRTTNLINSITKHLNHLVENQLELTAHNYAYNSYDGNQCRYRHIPRVLSHLEHLRHDPRWTPVMEMIFSELASDQCE